MLYLQFYKRVRLFGWLVNRQNQYAIRPNKFQIYSKIVFQTSLTLERLTADLQPTWLAAHTSFICHSGRVPIVLLLFKFEIAMFRQPEGSSYC